MVLISKTDESIDVRCIELILEEAVKEGIYGGVGGIMEEFDDADAGVMKFCGAAKELELKMSAGFT